MLVKREMPMSVFLFTNPDINLYTNHRKKKTKEKESN